MSFHRPSVSMVEYKTAGPLINHEVMVDAAWRKIVGLKPPQTRRVKASVLPKPQALTYDERLTISVIAGWTYTHDGKITTGNLVEVLEAYLDRKRDAVMRILRDLEEAQFISQIQSEDRGTVYYWQLRDNVVRAKLDHLVDVLAKIAEVIAIQRADPENSDAGKDLLPEGIYYNLVVRRNAHRAQS